MLDTSVHANNLLNPFWLAAFRLVHEPHDGSTVRCVSTTVLLCPQELCWPLSKGEILRGQHRL